MKSLPALILLLGIATCTSQQELKPAAIQFRFIDLSEANASAVRENKLILTYFFSDG
jgi:hypothetical protein